MLKFSRRWIEAIVFLLLVLVIGVYELANETSNSTSSTSKPPSESTSPVQATLTLKPTPISLPTASVTATPACITPGDLPTYKITRGDTLNAIATRYNTTVDQLIKINCLVNPNHITVGQVLVVPGEQTAEPSPTPKKP